MSSQPTILHRIRVSDDVRYLTIGQMGEIAASRPRFPRQLRFGGKTSARQLLFEFEEWEYKRAKKHDRAAAVSVAGPKWQSLKLRD
jgi:hypothetical protein